MLTCAVHGDLFFFYMMNAVTGHFVQQKSLSDNINILSDLMKVTGQVSDVLGLVAWFPGHTVLSMTGLGHCCYLLTI